jgi:hypothetical protein
MLNIIKITITILLFISGVVLTTLNIYGEFKNIRTTIFFDDELRFNNDQPTEFQNTISQLAKLEGESDLQFSKRITKVIAAGLAHIHWERYDAEKFNQLIPIWENYFLYFMGKFSGIPEFEKYHFANYERSLERGIGICGDASMVLSQVLTNNNIVNNIITFPDHVVVSAKFDNKEKVFDPDFGVSLPFSPEKIMQSPSLVSNYYLDAGYFDYDIKAFNRIYNNNFQRWGGVKHFITKKYYFEKISYWLKWPFPILLILISMLYFIKRLKIAKS